MEREHGLEYGQPIQRVREFVEIIRKLLRDGKVSYSGTLVTIEGFDMWFTPPREVPIFLSAVNPKMLAVCGEIAQGVILTRSTVEQARDAVERVAAGARSVGRRPEEVEVSAMLACSIAASRDEARDRLRGRLAAYAGRFPRYRNQMAAAGFAAEVEAVRAAWERGDYTDARRLVPAALIDQTAIVGSPEECRERIRAYRQAGITLPLVVPSVEGDGALTQAMEVIRACAPE